MPAGVRRNAVAAVALAAVVVVAIVPLFMQPVATFDEGITLAYPVQVEHGELPGRDYASFYGPGNPLLLAGVFEVFGESVGVERAVGVIYRLAVVAAIVALLIELDVAVAVTAAGCALLVLLLTGPYALPTIAALALLLVEVVAFARGRPAVAGAVAGAVLLFRPDFVLAAGGAALPFLLVGGRRRFAIGLAGPLLAIAVYAVLVGDRWGRLLGDLVASGPGRRLPLDWSRPEVRVLVIAALIALVAVLIAMRTRNRPAAAVALMAVGLLPYAASRADFAHVPMVLAPAIVALALLAAADRGTKPLYAALTPVAVLLLAAATAPEVSNTISRHFHAVTGQHEYDRFAVHAGDRSVALASADEAANAQKIVDAAQAERSHGARTLFVGPGDLRRAFANDVVLYYLLDGFKPASYYMEFNPRTANRDGSGLAGDIGRADLAILNSRWDTAVEPNDSRVLGPAEPNDVIAQRFCEVTTAGTYRLLRRCR